jgi:hypothetical protein
VKDETREFIIEQHGKDNFEIVYAIMEPYREQRFAEDKQRQIESEVMQKLGTKGIT